MVETENPHIGSKDMVWIESKSTKLEICVKRYLHAEMLRFLVNYLRLEGGTTRSCKRRDMFAACRTYLDA
jgi:hypothetical protein